MLLYLYFHFYEDCILFAVIIYIYSVVQKSETHRENGSILNA